MSYTKIGRNKVYASIEDLPENLKLVNGDRLLIQTDNGTALVDWENVRISKENITFKNELESLNDFVDAARISLNEVEQFKSSTSDGISALCYELLMDASLYMTGEDGRNDGDVQPASDVEPANHYQPDKSPRLKNILARLNKLETGDPAIDNNTYGGSDVDYKITEHFADDQISTLNDQVSKIIKGETHLPYVETGEDEIGTINSKITELSKAIDTTNEVIANMNTTQIIHNPEEGTSQQLDVLLKNLRVEIDGIKAQIAALPHQ